MATDAGPSASTDTLEDFRSYAKDCHDLEEKRRQSLRDESRQLAAFIYVLVGLESAAAVRLLAAQPGLIRSNARLGILVLLFILVCAQILFSIRMLHRAYTDRVPSAPQLPSILAEHLSGKGRNDILCQIGDHYNEAAKAVRRGNERTAADVRCAALVVCWTLAAIFAAIVVVVFYGLNPSSLL